jgi:hypothetical protein
LNGSTFLTLGCGSTDDRFSTAEKDAITTGMSKTDVEARLGKPTTTALVIGNSEAVQWVRGSESNPSSIAITFVDGKVKDVIATNLR